MVAGRPSGGTSMLAGVLHHLGVDRGECPTVEQLKRVDSTRHYRGFECSLAVRMFGNLPPDATCDMLTATMHEYIRRRLSRTDGPAGVKLNSLMHLGGCEGLEELPLTVVAVERDLEATFASDIKYRGIDWGRAAQRGILDLAYREFVRRMPPVVTVRYEDAIERPLTTVYAVESALGLMPTLTQRAEAARSIDPVKCKWEGEPTT